MRLVDADKIRWKSYPNDYGETNDDYVEKCDINNMPTVDAVPVVRCKNCATGMVADKQRLMESLRDGIICGEDDSKPLGLSRAEPPADG